MQVHPSSVLAEDEYGKLPVYVVYHELINTTRPFMRNVCGVEQDWVKPILKKLEKLNINKLRYGSHAFVMMIILVAKLFASYTSNPRVSCCSGGSSALMDSELLNDKQPGSPTKATDPKQSDVDSKIQAARERYLARKGKK
jgi:ATP-dependent RNA helicase DHX8/PRP22